MPAPVVDFSLFGTPGSPDYHARKVNFLDNLNTALLQLWNQLNRYGGKFFASRELAVAYGQGELMNELSLVFTREGTALVMRGSGQSTDDPLFTTFPYWGVISRIDIAEVVRDTGLLTLTNVSGSINVITAQLPAAAKKAGVTATSGTSIVELIPVNTNDGTGEVTLSIDGSDPAPIRKENGGIPRAGEIVAGRSYLLRRRSSFWRIISGGVILDDLNQRVWHTTERNLAIVNPPMSVDQISVALDSGHVTWRRLTSAPGTPNPDIHAQTVDGRWWRLSEDSIAIKNSISALTAGRVFSLVQNTLTPSGNTTIPTNTNTLLVRRNNGGQEIKMWRVANAGEIPADGVDTATVVKDGTGKWWFLIFDGTTLANAGKFHVVIRNTLAVNEDTIPSIATTVMVRKNNGPDFALWRPATGAETPSDGIPTLITMQDLSGRWWTQIYDSRIAGWAIMPSRLQATQSLPKLSSLGCTLALVLEGTQMVLRARDAVEDPLFETSPRWGVAWSSATGGGSGNGAALFLPGRPDYERQHLPEYADVVMDQLKGLNAGFGLSLSYAKTFVRFDPDWFLTAQAHTSDQQPATVVTVPGYEPTTHVVHPCIMEMYDSFRGYRYVMAITAFPNRVDQLEDPFLYGSNDGLNWHLFPDMPQPLDVAPNEWSYQSDVWMAQDPRTGELYVCYREYYLPDADAVGDPSRQETRLKFRSTRDGVNWSEPHTFLTLVDHAANVSPISPSILFDAKTQTWHMWAVQRPNLGHWTAKSIYGPWTYHGTFPIAASRPAPPHHLEVKWVGDQIIALVGDRWTGDQFLARLSFENPRTWQWSTTICLLGDGGNNQLDSRYKATFLPRIKSDGTMRFGIWWTGGDNSTLNVRYAESRQSFAIQGWGRPLMWETLQNVATVSGGYSGDLLTPMNKPATIIEGTRVRVTFPTANTTVAPSLQVNGIGYTLRARLGKTLAVGDIQPGTPYEVELRSGNVAICLDVIK